MLVNAATIRALNTSFNMEFNRALENVQSPLDAVTSRVPSTTKSQKYPLGALTSAMRQWVGDRVVNDMAAYADTVENLAYEHTLGVDRDDIEDDQVGVYKLGVAQLAADGAMHPWDLVETELGANAFSDEGFDGAAFFAATHTWPGGGYTTAQDNVTDELLDSAAVYTGLSAMSQFRGPSGNVLRVRPTHFLYAPAIEDDVDTLFNTPNSAAGAGNPHYNRFPKDRQIKMEGWTGNQWVMLDCSKPIRPVIFQERRKLALTSMVDPKDTNVFMRKQFLWGVDYRGAVKAIAWWLAYGSDGTE